VRTERLTDIDLIARKLEEEATPNDLIVVNPWQFRSVVLSILSRLNCLDHRSNQ